MPTTSEPWSPPQSGQDQLSEQASSEQYEQPSPAMQSYRPPTPPAQQTLEAPAQMQAVQLVLPDQAEQYPAPYPAAQYPDIPYPFAPYPSSYLADEYRAPSSYTTPPAPLKSRRWVLSLLLVALLLASGAALALTRAGTSANAHPVGQTSSAVSTPAAASTATVTSSNFTQYTDIAGAYQLTIPPDWSAAESSGMTTLTSSSLPDVVELQYLDSPLDGQQNAAADGFFSAIASDGGGGRTISNRQGPTPVWLAGEIWSEYTADATNITASGVTDHVVFLIAAHAGGTALIAYLAPQDSFESDDNEYFQPMLATFTFLN